MTAQQARRPNQPDQRDQSKAPRSKSRAAARPISDAGDFSGDAVPPDTEIIEEVREGTPIVRQILATCMLALSGVLLVISLGVASAVWRQATQAFDVWAMTSSGEMFHITPVAEEAVEAMKAKPEFQKAVEEVTRR